MIKLKSLLEVRIKRADAENPQFLSGMNIALQDKQQDKHRSLRGMSDDFIRGYKTIKRESWWSITNSKVAEWLGKLGYSSSNTGIWRK